MSALKAVCLLAVLVIAQASVQQSEVPKDVRSGFYTGRSGNVVLKANADEKEKDVFSIFLNSASQHHFKRAPVGEPALSAVNFPDVVTRVLGVSPINEEYKPSFVESDFFNRPKANLMVAVESVGADTIWRYNLHNLKQLSSAGTSKPVSYASFPASSLAIATTLASGHWPAAHGIVSRQWQAQGKPTKAFSGTGSNVANVADIVAQVFKGQSLIVSASGDSQLAAAFCPNPVLVAQHPDWNNYCISFDKETLQFKTLLPGAKGTLFTETNDDIRTALSENNGIPSTGEVVVRANADGTISVTYRGEDGQKDVLFDLSVPEDFLLFAELHYILSLPSRISSSDLAGLVTDNIPDLYSFSIASLTGLIEKYGRESNQFIAAVKLIDNSLPEILRQYAGLYPNALVSEIVLLGSHDSMLARTDMREAVAQVARILPQQTGLQDYLPYLYVQQSGEQLLRTCEALNVQLKPNGFSAYCPQQNSPSLIEFSVSTQPHFRPSLVGNSTYPDTRELQRYQIALWVSILLVVILAVILYSTIYMDIRKDSILYGNFNPNWEDRKKGR